MLTSEGVRLRDVYLGPGGVLTGSARLCQEAEERRREIAVQHESLRREIAAKAGLQALEAKIAALEAERKTQEHELDQLIAVDHARRAAVLSDREELGRSRSTISDTSGKRHRPNGREAQV
jgi:circadian clock protein KaiC